MSAVAGLIIWVVAVALGGIVGYRIARLIPTTAPESMAPTALSELSFKITMWLFRVSIFVIAMVGVSFPFLLLIIVLD